MTFRKGETGNAGGRVDPRKSRAREAIVRVVDESSDRIAGWFDAIERDEGPKAALQAFIALAEYALPKLARTEIAGELNVRRLTDAELDARIADLGASLGYTIMSLPAHIDGQAPDGTQVAVAPLHQQAHP